MKISPQSDCIWDCNGARLCIRLTADDGVTYLFESHYMVSDLFERPDASTSFCIQDARLLTCFQEGLSKIGLDDSSCLDLGLNAVACARFVRAAIPCSRYFKRSQIPNYKFSVGDVVSLYSKTSGIADCLVLEECDGDYLVRLMLLNPSYTFSAQEGRKCVLGAMIRVKSEYVCPSRIFAKKNSVRYA